MRRALSFTLTALLTITAGALIGASAAAPTGTGTVTFTGRIIDPGKPLVPGMVVTIHGAVVARSAGCIETRIEGQSPTPNATLWLCANGAQSGLPAVGESVHARARITRTRDTSGGPVPVSDSFILLGAG